MIAQGSIGPKAARHRQQMVNEAPRLQHNGLRCTEQNAVDVADDLEQTWSKALQHGYHVWVLHLDKEPVSSTDYLSEYPRACAQPARRGYHLRCWSCGLTHATSRRKAVLSTGCAATKILTDSWTEDGRVAKRCCRQEIFTAYLKKLNQQEERRFHHWPALT